MRTAWLILLVLSASPLAFGESVQFDLSEAADKDLVYEADENPSADKFGENELAHESFVETGYADDTTLANGMPSSRLIRSTRSDVGEYSLLPYNGNNVIEMAANDTMPFERHDIDVPNRNYRLIGMLVSSVDGDTSFTIRLKYKDGMIQVLQWEADDWYQFGTRESIRKVAYGGMDRVDKDTGKIDDADHYNLYEFLVIPDSRRVLDSITIGTDPHRYPIGEARWGAVFAINGVTVGGS